MMANDFIKQGADLGFTLGAGLILIPSMLIDSLWGGGFHYIVKHKKPIDFGALSTDYMLWKRSPLTSLIYVFGGFIPSTILAVIGAAVGAIVAACLFGVFKILASISYLISMCCGNVGLQGGASGNLKLREPQQSQTLQENNDTGAGVFAELTPRDIKQKSSASIYSLKNLSAYARHKYQNSIQILDSKLERREKLSRPYGQFSCDTKEKPVTGLRQFLKKAF